MPTKTPVSNAGTYQEIGAFWDDHDATEFGEQTDTMFQVNVSSQRRYYPLDRDLSFEIKRIVEQHGISEETFAKPMGSSKDYTIPYCWERTWPDKRLELISPTII